MKRNVPLVEVWVPPGQPLPEAGRRLHGEVEHVSENAVCGCVTSSSQEIDVVDGAELPGGGGASWWTMVVSRVTPASLSIGRSASNRCCWT